MLSFEFLLMLLLFLGKHITLNKCLIFGFFKSLNTLFIFFLLHGHFCLLLFKFFKFFIMKLLGLLSFLFELFIVLFFKFLSLFLSLLLLLGILLFFLLELTVLDFFESSIPIYSLKVFFDFLRTIVMHTKIIRATYSFIYFSLTFLSLFLSISILNRNIKTFLKHGFLDRFFKFLVIETLRQEFHGNFSDLPSHQWISEHINVVLSESDCVIVEQYLHVMTFSILSFDEFTVNLGIPVGLRVRDPQFNKTIVKQVDRCMVWLNSESAKDDFGQWVTCLATDVERTFGQ